MKATLTEEQKKFIHEMVMKASKGSAEEQEFVIDLFGEQGYNGKGQAGIS